MSKLAFTADVHIGNPSTFGGPVVCGINTRGEQVLDVLARSVKAIQGHDALVICGDLFDISHPSPQIIRKVQEILREIPHVIALLGNHDMVSTQPGDHALGPLRALPNVHVMERPGLFTFGESVMLTVPFQPGDGKQWLPEVLEAWGPKLKMFNIPKVLTFHLGISDEDTPSFLRDSHEAVPLELVQSLMEQYDIDYAYCGNWHTPKTWGRIVQCGALCPTGWDNPGWEYGLVRTLNTTTGHMGNIAIPGPRFLNATTEEEAQIARLEAARRKCELYLSLKGEAAAHLDTVREWGVTARAVVDTTAAKEATQAAARAVKGAGTLKEALARYVAEMPLADGVDRQKVQALAGSYLTRGA